MERLFSIDQVAYVRFASVYQRFDDVRRFAQLLERMSRRARQSDRNKPIEE
jgi:transcriptional repressor NrdR